MISYTAKQGGYFRVFVNGAEVSQHTTEREALERAENEEGGEGGDPSRDVVVTHDGYSVSVESAEVALDLAAGQEVELRLVASDPLLVEINGLRVKALADAGSVVFTLERVI